MQESQLTTCWCCSNCCRGAADLKISAIPKNFFSGNGMVSGTWYSAPYCSTRFLVYVLGVSGTLAESEMEEDLFPVCLLFPYRYHSKFAPICLVSILLWLDSISIHKNEAYYGLWLILLFVHSSTKWMNNIFLSLIHIVISKSNIQGQHLSTYCSEYQYYIFLFKKLYHKIAE